MRMDEFSYERNKWLAPCRRGAGISHRHGNQQGLCDGRGMSVGGEKVPFSLQNMGLVAERLGKHHPKLLVKFGE